MYFFILLKKNPRNTLNFYAQKVMALSDMYYTCSQCNVGYRQEVIAHQKNLLLLKSFSKTLKGIGIMLEIFHVDSFFS